MLNPGAVGVAAAISVAVPLLDRDWRTASHHGFFHHAIVYRIFDHGVPPENPLFAGEPLRYYYGLHAALAGIMKVVPIDSASAFALVNLATVVLFVLVVDRLGRLLDRDPAVRACACLLAITGLDPFTRGWLAAALKSTGWPIERRALPWHKFVTVNAGQVGALIAALALWLLARSLGRRALAWETAAFCGLTTAAACVYPYAWVAIVGWTAIAGLERLLRRRPLGAMLRLGAAMIIGSLLAAPYMLAVTRGHGAELQPALSATVFLRHGAVLASIACFAAALALAGWNELRASWNRNQELAPLLLAWGLAVAGLFFAARLFDRTEYKFLLFAMTPLGVLLAPALCGALRARPLVAAVLIVSLLLPIAAKGAKALDWSVEESAMSVGRELRAVRAEEDALHRWILSTTPPSAIFVDTGRTVPVFDHRSLFVALDEPAANLHAVTGVPLARVERRRRLAEALVSERDSPTGDIAALLREETPGRPLYVVARTAKARERMTALVGAVPAYTAENAAVFQVP